MGIKSVNKIYFSISFLVVLFILSVVFFIYPLIENIKEKSQEILSQKEKLINLENTISDLEEFRVLYQDLGEILDEIDNLLIDPEVPVEFIAFLEKISQECLIDSEILMGGFQKSEESFWNSVSFQINIKGSSPDLLKFLEKLENSPYLINIRKLTLNQSDTKLGVNLSISVYAE